MAHEIEARNGVAQFIHAGEQAWHGLGERIGGASIEKLIKPLSTRLTLRRRSKPAHDLEGRVSVALPALKSS